MNTSAESLAWIASNYAVPARRGQHIRFAGALARITGASGPHLRARMLETCRWATEGAMVTLHPTWEVEYVTPPLQGRGPTMPDCTMADDPAWPGKPRVCAHSEVIASGGTCADEQGWAEVFEPPIGPDCRDDKCGACDGRALDEQADEIVQCECSCHAFQRRAEIRE